MLINNVPFEAELSDIITELQTQLALNHIPLLQIAKDSGEDIMVQCPYHKDGQERKPSAGIRKSDGKFHCFRAGTKVITKEYGAIEIEKLVNNDVHILNGNGKWEKVIFNNYGKQPLMKITLSCNTKQKVIYATPEHEWLIKNYNKKYQTQQLKLGMYLAKCVPQNLSSVELDPNGIVHGFCYGDGNNRVCKDGSFYNRCFFYNEHDLELKQYFTKCNFTTEIAGNRKEYECALFKSDRNLKCVPNLFESDSYLMGFLAGYFVADGNCFNNKISIYSHKYSDLYKIQQICTKLGIMSTEIGVSNIHRGQRGCLVVKEDTNGYTLRLVRNTIPNNFFITKKGKNSIQRYTSRNSYKVIRVEATDLIEDVYCCMTTTHSFALEHFILTGNCFACGETHELQEVISYCFGHNDILGSFGWKWLNKNFKSIAVEERKDIEIDFSRNNTTNKTIILDTCDSDKFKCITEEELNEYRYIHPYMFKRKLTESVIELFDVGYDAKTDCITFPVRDINGNCMFIARRSVRYKYFNYPKGVEKPLYGLYELYQLEKFPDEVYICESMLDALTIWCYNKYAVALNGLGNELSIAQIRKLPCRKVILATDKDDAGKKARIRLRKELNNKIVVELDYRTYPDRAKDMNDMTREEFYALGEVF